MSVIKSIYGTNGQFVNLQTNEHRMDLITCLGGSAGEFLEIVTRKFGTKFANEFKLRFKEWSDDSGIDELTPNHIDTLESTILGMKVGLTKADIRDHLSFFYGEVVAEEFDKSSPAPEGFEFLPLIALMFASQVLVNLKIEPIEPDNLLLILYIANDSFESRMKQSLV